MFAKIYRFCTIAFLISAALVKVESPALGLETLKQTGPSLSAGFQNSCMITTQGKVKCWGANEFGESSPPSDLQPSTQISVGLFSACTVDVSGSVRCWGNNDYGQTSVPKNLGSATQVHVGPAGNACAVLATGKLSCWGDNYYGNITVPKDLNPIKNVSLGSSVTCATDFSGNLRCWGNNDFGLINPPTIQGAVVQVAVGNYHACALSELGVVTCWGDAYGNRNVPNNLGTVSKIFANVYNTCALNDEGIVHCWGADNNIRNQVQNLGPVDQFSLGVEGHACGSKADGRVVCFGDNPYGAATVPESIPAQAELATLPWRTCGIDLNGVARCWGYNGGGMATPPKSLGRVKQIAGGYHRTCALEISGQIYCWGPEAYEGAMTVPKGLGVVTEIASGAYHLCALSDEGKITCWGQKQDQVNGGLLNWNYSTPNSVSKPIGISAGGDHSCALYEDGSAKCWGDGSYGQTTVPQLGRIKKISTSHQHTCALEETGNVTCWGNTINRVPNNLGTVKDISTASNSTCAIDMSNRVRCWGANESGQTSIPADLQNVKSLSAGNSNTVCATTFEGASVCWGNDMYGQAKLPVDLGDILGQQIQNRIAPAISGERRVGGDVMVQNGIWSPNPTFSYQWLRDGNPIADASNSAYTLTSDDFSHHISIEVTANLSGYTALTVKTEPFLVEPGTMIKTPAPDISGSNLVGSQLRAETQDWDSGTQFQYQWLREGTPIEGETGATYTLTANDKLRQVAVEVTGSLPGFTPVVRTSEYQLVTSTPISTCQIGFTVPIDSAWNKSPWLKSALLQPSVQGSAKYGSKLFGVRGSWPSQTKFCVYWYRNGEPISRAFTTSYQTQPEDVGQKIQYVVVGIDKLGRGALRYSKPIVVSKAVFTNTQLPKLSGQLKVGSRLSANTSLSWAPGTSYTYQWLRNGQIIQGANTSTYFASVEDLDSIIGLRVCGAKPLFEDICRTNSFAAAVTRGVISPSPRPVLLASSLKPGSFIQGLLGDWPQGVSLSVQWLRNGERIQGATNATYEVSQLDRGNTLTLKVTANKDGYLEAVKLSTAKKIN
jgi:alpha-tubulin suppressor-like RCC1 family protein